MKIHFGNAHSETPVSSKEAAPAHASPPPETVVQAAAPVEMDSMERETEPAEPFSEARLDAYQKGASLEEPVKASRTLLGKGWLHQKVAKADPFTVLLTVGAGSAGSSALVGLGSGAAAVGTALSPVLLSTGLMGWLQLEKLLRRSTKRHGISKKDLRVFEHSFRLGTPEDRAELGRRADLLLQEPVSLSHPARKTLQKISEKARKLPASLRVQAEETAALMDLSFLQSADSRWRQQSFQRYLERYQASSPATQSRLGSCLALNCFDQGQPRGGVSTEESFLLYQLFTPAPRDAIEARRFLDRMAAFCEPKNVSLKLAERVGSSLELLNREEQKRNRDSLQRFLHEGVMADLQPGVYPVLREALSRSP